MKKTELMNEFYAREAAVASKGYHNAIGGEFDAIGSNFEADGGAAPDMKLGKALPYIIKIANANTSDATNVPIFWANKYARNSAALPAGITYTVSNFDSYDTFLFQTMSKKFLVGRTYWSSSSTTQVADTVFTVINYDGDGRSQTTPIVPFTNKFAQQSGVNDDDTSYLIDGNALVQLDTLYASTTTTIRFYAAEVLQNKNDLSGKPAILQYEKPYTMGMIQ